MGRRRLALIAWGTARLTLVVAARLPKRSLAQVFVLVAIALLAVGVARMLAVPVFLTLFVMGALLAFDDAGRRLAYAVAGSALAAFAIILFSSLSAPRCPGKFTWLTALQALGFVARALPAKSAAAAPSSATAICPRQASVGRPRHQPLSATTVSWPTDCHSIPRSAVRRCCCRCLRRRSKSPGRYCAGWRWCDASETAGDSGKGRRHRMS